MAVATGTALLAGAGISAAANLLGAKKASSAARDAAQIQSRSADQARRVQGEVYRDQRALMDPYINMGTTALNSLMQQYGNAGSPMPGYGQPTTGGRPAVSTPGGARSMEQPTGELIGARPNPQPIMSLASMGQGPTELWTVEAPDGSGVRELPPLQAQKAIQMGARRVYGRGAAAGGGGMAAGSAY